MDYMSELCDDCGCQTCVCPPLTAPIAGHRPARDECSEYLELATDLGGEG
jgi:hypothetical protein